jgi:fumarate reductase iron-sulfur subunit
MKIKIKRDNGYVEYEVSKNLTLLQALFYIKQNIDSSLTFDSGCKSAVCGACSVRVNGKETLACATKINDNDLIEPLKNLEVLRDLKVKKSLKTLKRAKDYLIEYKEVTLNSEDEKLNSLQSDCIMCNSCYSACPVLEVNKDFLGPFALTKAYKLSVDKREENQKEHIDTIQKNGIWDCTLCGECTLVCPKSIDPKSDIINLRNLSAKYGYSDPNFANMNFGFDPNAGF